MPTLHEAQTHAKHSNEDTFLVKNGATYHLLKAVDAWLDLWSFFKEPAMGMNLTTDEVLRRYPKLQILSPL